MNDLIELLRTPLGIFDISFLAVAAVEWLYLFFQPQNLPLIQSPPLLALHYCPDWLLNQWI
jgi:hypothetical protein